MGQIIIFLQQYFVFLILLYNILPVTKQIQIVEI